MTLRHTFATTILFLGDTIVFALSLWLMLIVRYGEDVERARMQEHFVAFAPLFVLWLLIFYMAGLYGKNIVLFKASMFRAIMQTQFFNIVIAGLYFFVVPVGIAPKTNLVLYLLISLTLILTWRSVLFPLISRPKKRESAVLVGKGSEVDALYEEVNANAQYHLLFTTKTSGSAVAKNVQQFVTTCQEQGVATYIVDTSAPEIEPVLSELYTCVYALPNCQVLDFEKVYEEVFDRIPLSHVTSEWFVRHASKEPSFLYRATKRTIDIVGGLLMGCITLIALPFVWFCMLLEGAGPVFISQERIGQHGKNIRAYKFRSMRFSDSGKWKGEGENYVTRVGAFLRQTSLDEFPQCINILRGDISLIGPRNDIRALGERLREALPFYQMRYSVTPGITGWAQINQQYEQGNISPQSIEETKVRLAYDFYYIKNRSLVLDIVIALKTVKRMLFRVSSW